MAYAIDENTKAMVPVYPATDTYTKSETDNLLSGKSDTSHNHDSRYYTESEVNNLLSGKSNNGHTHDDRYYTETEVNNLLSGKSNTNHTHDERYYTEYEVNNILNNYLRLEKYYGSSNGGRCRADAVISGYTPLAIVSYDLPSTTAVVRYIGIVNNVAIIDFNNSADGEFIMYVLFRKNM